MRKHKGGYNMFNYEYEMSMMLQRRLKPIVKGKIFVHVCDDILRVEMTNPLGGVWYYRLEDFARHLIMGTISINSLVTTIVRAYKKDMLNGYLEQVFYQD